MSPADLRRQNPKTTLITKYLSLRNNTALLHSSPSSAVSAGEYSRKSTQSICTDETPMYPADPADLRRRMQQAALFRRERQIDASKIANR